MKTSDFYYDLPPELIAQTPLERRDQSRLMVLDRNTGAVSHEHFYDLSAHLRPGDCLVLNNSRVLPARLIGRRESGGVSEVLLLTDKGDNRWECLVRPGKKLRTGAKLRFGEGELTAEIEQVLPDGNRLVRFHYEGIFLEVLEKLGRMPCPPTSARSWRTRSAIRPFTPRCRAARRHPRRACTSRRSCSNRLRTWA